MLHELDIWEDAFDIGRQTEKSSQEHAGIDPRLLKTVNVLLKGKEALTESSASSSNIDIDFMLAKLLRSVLGNRQRDYSTTIAEDLELLESTTLQPRQSMAIQVRLGEKEILAETSHYLDSRLATFAGKTAAKTPKQKRTSEHKSHSVKRRKK